MSGSRARAGLRDWWLRAPPLASVLSGAVNSGHRPVAVPLSSRAGGLERGSAEPRRRNQASPEGSAPAGCARAEGESAWESGGREAPAGRAGPRRLRSVRSDSRELGGRGGEEGMWNKENSWVRAMRAKVCRGVGGALM